MRGKRSKQYRKLMNQYHLNFGFREPYQVLVDAEMLRDADRFKMDLVGGLERTLHGQVKPMITQCSMRHLYAASSESGVSYLIDKAKTYERRRCGHLPADYPEPLSTETCLTTVVDPKGSKTNKHRYVVASQDVETRKAMRAILGVPLVYINRSVMIMEPMAGATAENREREERKKFRDGLKRGSGSLKRKREEDGEGEGGAGKESEKGGEQERAGDDPKKKKRNVRGVKGPNPLSVKKTAKTTTKTKTTKPEAKSGHSAVQEEAKIAASASAPASGSAAADEGVEATSAEPATKRRRRRKHKPEAEAAGTGEAGGEVATGGDSE